MTSAESAARFRAMYEGRLGHLPELIRDTTRHAAMFRSVVLDSIGHFPRPFRVVLNLVTNDWGTVNERRLYNAIGRLIADGQVARTPDGYKRAA
jgi:hypothetical protein